VKISINWLKEYVQTESNPNEISRILTNLGLEVEKIDFFETVKGGLKGIVAGKVIKCEKHPNADRLKLTTIDLGENQISEIVCGAPNIEEGQIVPVAIVGTKIFGTDGTEIKIKKSKIRGVVSNGMVCAEDEIGLGDSHDGIMILDKSIKPGTPISEVFNIESDNILEIGLTPNRSDAMSHYGVARDLKAYFDYKSVKSRISLPSINSFESVNIEEDFNLTIEDKDKCPFYSGLIIKNIEVRSSSNDLQNKLKSIGLKPINNIVDITNFVMHEIGQPLHAFDFDKIDNIKIKSLKSGSKFKTLDGEVIELDTEDLLICTDDEPLCIAGVYGGIESGVNNSTKNLFIESAIFDSVTVRKTSKRHQIYTDASYRYERGVDPEKVLYALKRAAIMIKDINPNCDISEILLEDNLKLEKKNVYLRYEKIENISGHKIDKELITQILNSLEFEITGITEDGINIIAPNYRHDVYREIDVIEEILRVYGFDNINIGEKITMSVPEFGKNKINVTESIISKNLLEIGFNEIINNSISSPRLNGKFKMTPVEIINPQGIELSNLRTSLIPSMLGTIKHNINRQNKNLKLFEIGSNYYTQNDDYFENKRLNVAVVGEVFEENWLTNYNENNFYYLKGISKNILKKLNISNIKYEIEQDEIFVFKLKIISNKKEIGFIGELDLKYTREFSVDDKVHILNLDIDNIKPKNLDQKYQELTKFPSSRRDISMILDETVKFEEIEKIAYDLEKKILVNVNLFDEFKGKKIGDKKKSFAVSFTFNDSKKTLTDKLVDKIMSKFSYAFESKLGAVIRDK
tara:strand:+ start:24699 stop:27107 length:2409 start_codon:yes stop_codon:yes gene_type:complete